MISMCQSYNLDSKILMQTTLINTVITQCVHVKMRILVMQESMQKWNMPHKYYEDSKCLDEAVVTLMKDPHEYGS